VNRPFEPFDTSQGNPYHPAEISSDGWLAAGAHSGIPSAQPQEEAPPQVTHRPAGKGLLSSWKPTQLQPSRPAGNATSMVDQETWKQPAVQGPVTGNAFNTGNTFLAGQVSPHQSGIAQPFLAGQVSPHQSGINPLAAAFPSTQTPQPFVSQPSAPMAGPQAQPFQTFRPAPMPGQPQAQWQTTGFQGSPPPFVQGYGQSQGPKNKPRKKKRRFPIWARIVTSILLVILVLIGSAAYYYYANFAAPVSGITGQPITRVKGDDNPNQGRDSAINGNILSGGRFNILLLGSDDDYKSVHIYGGILAQTDIVVSIDPATKSVAMLSIPRDSWVNVPGYGMHKLDQAYLLGGGGANGAALSMATIHQDFGIYISHYAWVGLSGFTKVINTVNGVDVDVLHPITDDSYPDDSTLGALDPYAYKRLYIAPGPQHLTGLQALEYVRSRHADLVGDFGRSVRQQQILDQLKYKLNNPNIFGELPALAQDLNGSVKTDMQLGDVFNLMSFARTIDQSKIQRVTLGPPYSGDAQLPTSAGVQDVVILKCALVQPLIAKMFALGNSATCEQSNASNTSTSASTIQPSPISNSTIEATPKNNSWQQISQMSRISAMSLDGNGQDFMGIRSLLDLLFTVVFESPAALQV
jgi:LCP family protein required for cell wall assembly